MKRVSVLSLAAIAASCATATPFVVTGQSTKVLGSQFLATAALMDAGLEDGSVSVAQYRAWRTFGERFQAVYPIAVDAWELARKSNDLAKEREYAALIAQLALELGTFYDSVKGAVKVFKGPVILDGGA